MTLTHCPQKCMANRGTKKATLPPPPLLLPIQSQDVCCFLQVAHAMAYHCLMGEGERKTSFFHFKSAKFQKGYLGQSVSSNFVKNIYLDFILTYMYSTTLLSFYSVSVLQVKSIPQVKKQTTSQLTFCVKQRAKKVVSHSLGLVDFATGLVNSVFNLPDRQVIFFEEFK